MLIALALACSGSPEATPAGPQGPPEVRAGKEGTKLDDHMKEHFRDATIAMEAWVGGNFPSAESHLGYLAKHPAPKGLPDSVMAHVEKMQEAALRAATPAPPSDTARAFADLGAACGGCHEASGVKPQIVLSDPPKASEDVQPHMVGHLWAVRAMWIGLVTNDADVWVRGATHLSGDPLHGEAFEIGEMPEHLLEFAKSVHANGAKAGDAKDTKARLEAFTGVVQSCGDCHLEMRGE